MKKRYVYKVHQTNGMVRNEVTEGKATLEQLQKWVGGYIEHVRIAAGLYVYVNEEGLLQGLPQNPDYGQLVGNVVELPTGCRN